MNFQQLRYVREAVRHDLNLTEAANALMTSQSGVSKQIRELEIQLGAEIFVRKGKRLISLTRAGEMAVRQIERVLNEAENLRRLTADYSSEDRGTLVIATTYNQARYTLPDVVMQFVQQFPDVRVALRQLTPKRAAESVMEGKADIAIATEALDQFPELLTFPCFSWRHAVVVPESHPLAGIHNPSLEVVAGFPVVTYSNEFSGRGQIDQAFQVSSIEPDIRLTAMDGAVIQAYVQRGLGVGILSEMALAEGCEHGLVEVAGSRSLFEPSITKVALQRGALLNGFAYRFIEMFAPHLSAGRLRDEALSRLSLREPARSSPVRAAAIPTFGQRFSVVATAAKAPRGRSTRALPAGT